MNLFHLPFTDCILRFRSGDMVITKTGVTLADIDVKNGEQAQKEISAEFGNNKVIFVETDVSHKDQFEDAFEKTVEYFGNLDILINNAGIFNDSIWEREVSINLNGTIHGTFLGMEKYLKNYKQGEEAVIVNTSSIAGLRGNNAFPVYAGTKFAIMGTTSSWGNSYHYERTRVRVVSICPGVTATSILETRNCAYSKDYVGAWTYSIDDAIEDKNLCQTAEVVSKELVRILKYAKNGTVWVLEQSKPAYEFKMPLKESFLGNVLEDTD